VLTNKQALIKYSAEIGELRRHKNKEAHTGPRNLTYELKKDLEVHLNDKGWSPEDYVSKYPDCGVSPRTIRTYIKNGYLDITYQNAVNRRYRLRRRLNKNERHHQNLKAKLREEFNEKKNANLKTSVNRLSIEERPKSVNNRRYFGHWEGDLILSRDGYKTPVLVLVERKTRYVVIVRTNSRLAEDMIKAIDHFMLLHEPYVRSITFDNGVEFMSWAFLERIQVHYGKKTYFAHPNSPRERATNEYKNRIVRQYAGFIDYHKREQLYWDNIADIINQKPMRQALNGLTPAKAYHQEHLKFQQQARSKLNKRQKNSI